MLLVQSCVCMGRCIGRRICFCLATQKPMLNLYSGTVSTAALERVSLLRLGNHKCFWNAPFTGRQGSTSCFWSQPSDWSDFERLIRRTCFLPLGQIWTAHWFLDWIPELIHTVYIQCTSSCTEQSLKESTLKVSVGFSAGLTPILGVSNRLRILPVSEASRL